MGGRAFVYNINIDAIWVENKSGAKMQVVQVWRKDNLCQIKWLDTGVREIKTGTWMKRHAYAEQLEWEM